MKRYFKATFIVFAVLLACVGTKTAYAEKINSFNSKIQVRADGTLGVIETIVYDPENVPHHGIFRDIILKNAQGGRMQISNILVVDENGTPYQFVKSGFDTIDLKIGDPNQTFLTPKTYVIFYDISGAYSYYKDFDEIYWNATGNSWGFPIMKASAEVDLPDGVNPTQSACYYGVSGSTNSCTSGSETSANGVAEIFTAPGVLNSGEGLTVAVGFPKGVVPPESSASKTQNFILDYLWIFTLLIAPVSTFFLLLRSWRRKWRAPKGTGVIIPQYDAPQGLTPIEVAGVLDEVVPNNGISAEIVYLATKGYIKIAQIEVAVLFFTSKDYELQKLKEPGDDCSEVDKFIMTRLFGISSTVRLLSLKNKFYIYAKEINKLILDGLAIKGLFRENPTKIKNSLRVLGTVLLFSSLFVGALLGSFLVLFVGIQASVCLFAGVAIAGSITFAFNSVVSVKTAEGVAAKEWVLGFKEYLQIAEKDRINFHNAPEKKPEVFEKFLPYAMVLGVEKAWAKEFEGIYTTPPNWYSGPSGATFSAIAFTNSLGSFNSMMSSSVSAPGGSGGGGSAGGGGGGGGGGGW